MDDDEKRALFRGLAARPHPAPPAASSDDADSTSSSSLGSSVKSAPQTLPPPPPDAASSDADTVEPEEDPPSHPPPAPPPAPLPHGASAPPSPASSDASTVPPPSPAALQRFRLASSPSTAAPLHTAPRAVVVEVDDRGIDGVEADEADQTSRLQAESATLAGSYPKLSASTFKFRAPDNAVTQHLRLSDTRRATRGVSNIGVLPARIAAHLSSYQRDGVTFMYRLYERGRGGLLADAMGLGKTVQTVCFLGAAFAIWDRAVREQNADVPEQAPRILVVAPTSVRENWRNEFATWTPFRVVLYEKAEEPTISRKLRNGGADVVIAGDNPVGNYGPTFFSRPLSPRDSTWKWDVVIVDEIHAARNKTTKIYLSLKKIPKTVMFGLTGTAVQNKLKELWNVMSLVVPESLWPAWSTFRKDFIDIINRGTKKDASTYMRRKANDRIRLLRKLLAKHLVRRPKSIIESHLPGKTDYCVLMRMKRNGLQGYMYQRFQNSYDVKLLRDAKVPCDCGSMEISKDCCHRYPTTPDNLKNAPIWRMHHRGQGPCEKCPNCICLYLQHYSRSLAAHALLIMPEDDEPDREKAEFRKELFRYYLGMHAKRARGPLVLLEQDADISCKLNVALRLLKSFESSGHKTIIFYESLRLGAILQRWATNKRLVFEVIDGSVNKGERQGAVDRFNTNSVCSIFFISKKAGGTGLNICGADRVLIFEPCWNPTLDLQAGDRAHRLGQKRVVHIIRLVVENTIEHYVFKTAITKSQVSSAILDNTKEEWRIRENEIGSMHAMLRMGDVFASREGSQDEFRVVEAADLEGNETKNAEFQEENLNPGPPEKEPDRLADDSADEIDVLGDEVVCSLNVDVEGESWTPLEEETEYKAEKTVPRAPDSQFETDMLLCAGGASGKLVMSSTSARKRKRQLMGVNATQQPSGINPNGAEGINFDDASWNDVPLSLGSDAADASKDLSEPEEPIRRRRRVNPPPHVVSQETAAEKVIPWQSKAGRQNRVTVEKVAKNRKRPAAGKAGNAEKPKAKSAFAARARVRR